MTSRSEIGRKIMGQVLGEKYLAGRDETTSSFNTPMRTFIEEYAFGEAWSGDALPLKTRSMLVLALLSALGRADELKAHVNGAINNGCTVEELQEVFKMAAVYSGVHAGVLGIRISEGVLAERKIPNP